jgi:MoxR-like ATPase
MDQGLALEIMLSGESVLLTGPAGAGKTFVLNQFIRYAKGDRLGGNTPGWRDDP